MAYPERFSYTRKMAEALRTSDGGIGFVKELVRRHARSEGADRKQARKS
jgi:hypothetical protein